MKAATFRSRFAVLGCQLALVAFVSAVACRVKPSHSSTSVGRGCAPDTSAWSMNMLDFFLVTATGTSQELWDYHKESLHLSAPLDSAQIQLETSDAACSAALAALDSHFGTSSGKWAIVVRFDTLRSITVPPPRAAADSLAPIPVGHGAHLIMNADFSAVVDTLYY